MSHASTALGQQQQHTTGNYQTIIIADFSLKNKLLFECLFCKETFAKISCYLNHISKHEMKQIHKCTICKKIVIEDKHFHDHLLEKHREFVDLKKPPKDEVNNNTDCEQKASNGEMDNFYHQLPYPYYQQFPQIGTPMITNYIPAIPQQAQNNANIVMGA
jgi:hypothetical protein